jgi:hypothetical protein
MSKVMNKREARRWLFHYAAGLLENFDCSDPITVRNEEHPDDPEAAERETCVLQTEVPYVAARLRKLGRRP